MHFQKLCTVVCKCLNPFLSKDRLTRIKISINYNNIDDYVFVAESTNIFMLVVYFIQRSIVAMSSTVKAVQQWTRDT
jgi:hypothetical protein